MKLAADDVQSAVIPGCGHYCLGEAPGEVAAALTAFLARTGKASDMSRPSSVWQEARSYD